MKLMYELDFASTGAFEMSTFHQLSAGKSGSGVGSAPPGVAAATISITRATTARAVRTNRLGIRIL
jgi:hypothetical protein